MKTKKEKYYVVWIEGLSSLRGEKIHTLTESNHEYTTKMTEALRVRYNDRQAVKDILRSRGVADWTLENCMIKTNYAPKGTILNLFDLET